MLVNGQMESNMEEALSLQSMVNKEMENGTMARE
jgi:hypothetical protein